MIFIFGFVSILPIYVVNIYILLKLEKAIGRDIETEADPSGNREQTS